MGDIRDDDQKTMTPMTKQLYRVEVSMTYYALAGSQEEAEDYMSDAIDDAGVHGFNGSPSVCKEVGHLYDFEDGDLVYHDGREDIDVKRAFEIATGKNYASEIKRESDAMRARLAEKFDPSNNA